MKALLMKLFRWLRGRRKEPTKELLFLTDEYPPLTMDPVAFARDVLGLDVELEDWQKGIILDNPVRAPKG